MSYRKKNDNEFRRKERICCDCVRKHEREKYVPKYGRKNSKELKQYITEQAKNNKKITDSKPRYCKGCNQTKTTGHFSSSRANRPKFCDDCRKELKDHAIFTASLSTREAYVYRYHGLLPDDYHNFLKIQNNKCAICKEDKDECDLHVDHCHKTNLTRGLICKTCNTLIGMAKDNIDILENAKIYLSGNFTIVHDIPKPRKHKIKDKR